MEKDELTDLDDVPVEVMEEALEEAFGGAMKSLFLSLLRKRYGLKKGNSCRKAEVFQRALEETFGAGTVRVTMSLVIEKLQAKREVLLK